MSPEPLLKERVTGSPDDEMGRGGDDEQLVRKLVA